MQLFPEFRPCLPHSRLSIRLPSGLIVDTTASVVIKDDAVVWAVIVISVVVGVSEVVVMSKIVVVSVVIAISSLVVWAWVEVALELVESVSTSVVVDIVVVAIVFVVKVVVLSVTVWLLNTDEVVNAPALPDSLALLSIEFEDRLVSHSTPDFQLEHSPMHEPWQGSAPQYWNPPIGLLQLQTGSLLPLKLANPSSQSSFERFPKYVFKHLLWVFLETDLS